MTAKVNSDGSIAFGANSIFSTSDIFRDSIELLKKSREKSEQYEQAMKIRELRKSCGETNPPITIKMPEWK